MKSVKNFHAKLFTSISLTPLPDRGISYNFYILTKETNAHLKLMGLS